MSAMPTRPGRSTETPRDTATAGPVRHGRLRAAAAARGVPLATIVVTVAVVALTAWAGSPDSEPLAGPGPAVPGEQAPETGRDLRAGEPEPTRAELTAPTFDLSGEPCAWPRSGTRIFHSL